MWRGRFTQVAGGIYGAIPVVSFQRNARSRGAHSDPQQHLRGQQRARSQGRSSGGSRPQRAAPVSRVREEGASGGFDQVAGEGRVGSPHRLRAVSSLDRHFACVGAVLAGTLGLVCKGNRCCAMRTAAAIRIASIRSKAGAQTHPRRAEKSRGVSWSDIAGHHSVGTFVERSLRQPGLPRTS
jgi:hypothetical protein